MTNFLPTVADPSYVQVQQLEESDFVQGGPEGVDNLPHKQLAERDDYLKTVSDALADALKILKARVDGIDLSSGTTLREALLLSWLYKDDSPSFELFTPGFSWRDIDPILVTGATAGDDTLDLATTEGLKPGAAYVLMDASSKLLEIVEVGSVLTASRLRTRTNLAHTIDPAAGAYLARTSFAIQDGYATLEDGDVLFTRPITELRNQPSGQIVVRREAADAGTLTIGYRVPTTTVGIPYATAQRTAIVANSDGTRDEFYALGIGGVLEFRFAYANPDAAKRVRLEHMVVLPPARDVGLTLVAQPKVTSPADQASNVGQTPVIQLSPYYELYGRPQGGARFRIFADPAGANTVLDTASELLAAWNRVTGQSADFTDLLALGARDFLAVASGVSLRIQIAADGTLTTTPGTVTGDLRRVHGSAALLAAVGAAGAIRTSTDNGATYTTRTAAGAYAGIFAGVFVRNAFIVAVGDAGTIQRSVNAGGIFNAVAADAGYTGAFTDLAGDGTGNLVAVGEAGMIQTSNNDGQSWIRRNAPAGYTGTYRAVAFGAGGLVIAVGDNGALHKSTDYGASWAAKTPAAGFTAAFYGVAVQGANIVAVGANAAIQTSTDAGETFAARVAGGGATGPLRAVALDANSYGLALGDGGALQRTLRLEGAVSSYTVPAGYLATNRVYWLDAAYANQDGVWSPFSPRIAFATAATFAYVNAPQITAPAAGDTGVSLQPTIQTGPFSTVGQSDTHFRSRYQIATAPSEASSALVWDSGNVTDLLAKQSGVVLAAGQDYYARALHVGTVLGAGPFSPWVRFQAQNRPNQPIILSPTDGAGPVSTGPQVVTNAYSMPSGAPQDAIQVQASIGSGFAALIYDSGVVTDATLFTSLKIPAGTFAFGSKPSIRVRKRAQGGAWSAWSNSVTVTVQTSTIITDVYAVMGVLGSNANATVATGVDGTDPNAPVIVIARALRGPDNLKSPVDPVTMLFSSLLGAGKYIPLNRVGEANVRSFAAGAGLTGFTDQGFTLGLAADSLNEQYVSQSFETYKVAPGFFAHKRQAFTNPGSAGIRVDLSELGTVGEAWAVVITPSGFVEWQGCLGSEPLMLAAPDRQDVQPAQTGTPNISLDGTTLVFRTNASAGELLVCAWANNQGANGLIRYNRVTVMSGQAVAVPVGFRPQAIELRAVGRDYASGYVAGISLDRVRFDAVRGFGAGNDRALFPSTNAPETVDQDWGGFTDAGFTLGNPYFGDRTRVVARSVRSAGA